MLFQIKLRFIIPRSMGASSLISWLREERAPRTQRMAACSKENDRVQRNRQSF